MRDDGGDGDSETFIAFESVAQSIRLLVALDVRLHGATRHARADARARSTRLVAFARGVAASVC